MPTLSEIAAKRRPVEEVTKGLLSDSNQVSSEAGMKLLAQARDAGLGLRDYLTLAVDVHAGEHAERNVRAGLNGYEASLALLNLPFADNLEQGVLLQAAADTFQTYSGTRAMFPEVLDDMLRQQGRIDQIENTAAMVAHVQATALVAGHHRRPLQHQHLRAVRRVRGKRTQAGGLRAQAASTGGALHAGGIGTGPNTSLPPLRTFCISLATAWSPSCMSCVACVAR